MQDVLHWLYRAFSLKISNISYWMHISRKSQASAHPHIKQVHQLWSCEQCTQLHLPVLLQQTFQLWQSFIHHAILWIFLASKWVATFWNRWYCMNCYADVRGQVHASYWLQHLLPLSCSSDTTRSTSRFVCLAIFHGLYTTFISLFFIVCFEFPTGNHTSTWHHALHTREPYDMSQLLIM